MIEKGLVVMPFLGQHQLTETALGDALQQLSGHADVLLINTGAADFPLPPNHRVRLWHWDPSPPALSTVWNMALDYAWQSGYPDCMIWNNDVRVGSWIYSQLREYSQQLGLWFASPVNCRDTDPEAWNTSVPLGESRGGQDFSCFLMRPELHRRYRFDQRFQPAYFEDNDYVRRCWLGGDGGRLAGLPLPYLHLGSQTIAGMSDEARSRFQRRFEACRETYRQKWGGLPHEERRVTPDSTEDLNDVGTPGGWLGNVPRPAIVEQILQALEGIDRG